VTFSLPVVTAALAGFIAVFAISAVLDLVISLRFSPLAFLEKLLRPVRLIGTEGREPSNSERARIVVLIAFTLASVGWLISGLTVAVICAALGPVVAVGLMKMRRKQFRQTLQSQVAEVATAIADALSAGDSVQGALIEAADSTTRAARAELTRVASALQLGSTVKKALMEMRERAKSRQIDTLVAAVLTQQRSGGDLVRLLRNVSDAFHRAAKVQSDARVATSQARMTAAMITLMPTGALVLLELGSPGYVQSLFAKPISTWLTLCSLMLQLIGIVVIRYISRTGSEF